MLDLQLLTVYETMLFQDNERMTLGAVPLCDVNQNFVRCQNGRFVCAAGDKRATGGFEVKQLNSKKILSKELSGGVTWTCRGFGLTQYGGNLLFLFCCHISWVNLWQNVQEETKNFTSHRFFVSRWFSNRFGQDVPETSTGEVCLTNGQHAGLASLHVRSFFDVTQPSDQ